LDDSPKTKTSPALPLFNFFMRRLLSASVAKLLGFHPFRVLLFVFGGGVIAIFAIAAL